MKKKTNKRSVSSKKRVSPFSQEFWTTRGMTPAEADFKRNSMRPIKKEYWRAKGFSEEEALQKAIDQKDSNNKKGAKINASRPMEELRKSSQRCIEYWLAKGLTEAEGRAKIKEVQSIGSLENFQKRYGKVEGKKKWKARQIKWQNTMKSLPAEETERINILKACISLDNFRKKGMTNEEIVKYVFESRNIIIFSTLDEFENQIELDLAKSPQLRYSNYKQHASYYGKLQLDILDIKPEFFKKYESTLEIFLVKGRFSHYCLNVSEGLLRSSFEIAFYELLKEYNIKFKLDNPYPNSSMRYDFYLEDYDIYVEICPMYNIKSQKKYTIKMNKKKKLFNCILLRTTKEQEDFIKGILKI